MIRFRQVEEMVTKAGLEVLTMEKNCHIKARVRAADGRESVQIFPVTPSDRRGLKNLEASLKRFARGPQ